MSSIRWFDREPAPPQGQHVGVVDEYGTVWAGEPGASERLGDLVQRDDETFDLYLDLPKP